MLSFLGNLALSLNLGGSRKDAVTNAASILAVISGIFEVIVQAGIVPQQYQSLATGLLSIAGTIIGMSSGKTPDLRSAQAKELQ